MVVIQNCKIRLFSCINLSIPLLHNWPTFNHIAKYVVINIYADLPLMWFYCAVYLQKTLFESLIVRSSFYDNQLRKQIIKWYHTLSTIIISYI